MSLHWIDLWPEQPPGPNAFLSTCPQGPGAAPQHVICLPGSTGLAGAEQAGEGPALQPKGTEVQTFQPFDLQRIPQCPYQQYQNIEPSWVGVV